jgi:lysophospholipid acyltransferase (LPLAT)-like uncharacterized protein
MQYRSIKKKILRFIGNKFARFAVSILCKSLRIEEKNKSSVSSLLEQNQNMVFAFWHGTMLVPWYLVKNFSPSTIISKSKDGDLLAKILENWDYNVKRGSSSNGGKEVLEELIKAAKNNRNIAITPDGPRGPEKVMKAGGVIIAKKVQIPLILIGVDYKIKIALNSWDKLEIPFFFSRANIIYSDPIFIDENLSYEETDNKIKEIGNKLTMIQNKAEQN